MSERPLSQHSGSDPMPVFVIRAKDALAVPVLRTYIQECQEHGLAEQAMAVHAAVDEIRAWQQRNIDLTKLPDHPHVPATPTTGKG